MPNWTKEQLDAIEKCGTNIIVSAGAGSGKTAVLTERIAQKVKSGISIDHLLVLTFTNEAAREMKKRVREKIKDDKKQSMLLNSSYITTFDSYALSLVKKYHYRINVSSNVNIVEESIINMIKDNILSEVLDEMYLSPTDEFNKLMKDFFVKNDNVLRKSIININNKLDMKYNKNEYLNNYLANYYNENSFNHYFIQYESLVLESVSNLKRLVDNLTDYLDGDNLTKFNNIFANVFESNNYNDIKANMPLKMPILRGVSDDSGMVDKLKENVKNQLDMIHDLTDKSKVELASIFYSTRCYVKAFIEIITKLDQRINQYKFENDNYEFTDICKLSIQLLKNNEDIRLQLKEYFNEIMIDEYQDTSDLQEEFINLISNNNTYMVGDIKQSIYKFRNANSYIFKNKYDKYSLGEDGIKIDLLKNFRSREEVINNINLIFDLIMTNEMGGASYKKEHQMVFGNTSYLNNNVLHDMEILNYTKDNNYTKSEIEAFIIAKDIIEKMNSYKVQGKDGFRPLKYDDIVILIDRTSDFNLIKKIFLYFKIPLTMYMDETINNSDDVLIIKNIINLIISVKNKSYDEKFKYSFLSVGRSFLTDYDDNQLFSIISCNGYFETDIYSKINDIVSVIDELTINEIIHLIIEKFDFYNRIIKIGNINESIVRLDYLFSISSTLSNLGYTIEDFYHYLDETFKSDTLIKYSINKEKSGSVKIMTIHKSKGLEFELCYYAGLTKSFNILDTKERFKFDNKYGFITPYFREGIDNTFINELYKDNYLKDELSERIRLFYVALTRSKGKMCLILDFDEDEVSNNLNYHSFKDILLSIRDTLTPFIRKININELGLTKRYFDIKDSNYVDYIPKGQRIDVTPIELNSEIVKEEKYSKESRGLITSLDKEKMQLGTILHYILETIDLNDSNSIDMLDISDYYKSKIKEFLKLSILDGAKNIYREYEFIYEDNAVNRHGVIDLLIDHGNYFDIVDYKLKNVLDENYLKQLKGYKEYISQLTGRDVNIYLYSIIDSKLEKITSF